RAAPTAEHLDRLLAGMESTSGEAGRQIPPADRRRQSGYGANTAQQFAGREPQFTAAQLLHAAPSPGWFLLGLIAVLLEPSALHAQPTCRTERQKPAGIDDRPRQSALADAAGPRATSAPPHLTRGGWPPPYRTACRWLSESASIRRRVKNRRCHRQP